MCTICFLGVIERFHCVWSGGDRNDFGMVRDDTGAVLPDAGAALLNQEIGSSRRVQTDRAGRYSASSLSLGSYEVTATLEGLQTVVRSGIALTVGGFAPKRPLAPKISGLPKNFASWKHNGLFL